MFGRRTLALAVVALVAVLAVVRTAVVVGNYTLAKEEMRRQYKDHAEESVESTKAYVGWALSRIREGLGFKPRPDSGPGHPINYEDGDNHRPGKAEEIKNMATDKAGEVDDTTSTENAKETREAEEAMDKAKQGYGTAKKKAQETVDAAKDKYDAATRKVSDVSDRVSCGAECKDEL